jgi:riboflavin kinase/FMN adenylyltransferase
VYCLGVFDGLHQGHQALIAESMRLAKELGVHSGLLSFEPYPQAYFAKQLSKPLLPRLMRFRDKYRQLLQYELDRFVVLQFNQKLAALSGEDFVNRILVQAFNASGIVVGDDFRFGQERGSGIEELFKFSKKYGFSLSIVPPVTTQEGVRCSSSLLRQYLQTDDFVKLEEMLGRPYSLSGCVRPGAGRGRQIGVPTANVQVPKNALLLDGVYVVEAFRPNRQRLQGVANIGSQPTFLGEKKRIEVHAFDFNESCYGEYWDVTIRAKIRGIKKFNSIDELVLQIQKDIRVGRDFFI